MKSGYTHIEVLLDRSGSMQTIKADTEGGFATFLADQQKQPGEATLTLNTFNYGVTTEIHALDIKKARPFILEPAGGTALLDAMGETITDLGRWLSETDEENRPETVIFVIITDGEENSSKEWTRDMVFDLVKKQTDVYKWTFLYLGANQDAIKVGGALGVNAANSLSYATAKTGETYSTFSSVVRDTRLTGQSAGFSDQDRKDVT